jgi:TatD DNase family protein
MLVDSHAHLDDSAFGGDLGEVLRRAREGGVDRIVTIGTDLASSRRAQEISESQPDVFFSPGIHPHEADNPGDVEVLRTLASHPRAVAVGETGLDYVKNYSSVAGQKALFLKHLEIAQERDKPVSIHCREAHGDVIGILRSHAPLRGVIHCFSGSWADAERYLSLNFYLSIAAPVTYPSAQSLRDVVRLIPLDRLLVETDSPLLPPQKFRGKRNEPSYLRYAAAEIANVHGISLNEIGEATSRNARRLFGLP